MLISDIADRVQTAVGDGGGIYMKDAFFIDWVNEAIHDIYINIDVDPDNSIIEIPLAVGQFQWVVSTSSDPINKIHNMSIKDTNVELQEKPLAQIINDHGFTWATTNGTPRFYYRSWAPGGIGSEIIHFAPPTDTAITIATYVSTYPERLSAVSDNTDKVIPDRYVDDIVRFCVMRAHEREKDLASAAVAREEYNTRSLQRSDEAHKLDNEYHYITPDLEDFLS